MIALSLLSLLLAATALAAPARRDNTFHGACNVPASTVTLASSFDPVPSSPNYSLMGVGVQNYTCNSKGTYDSVGAYAQMYDISCLDVELEFAVIQEDAYNYWKSYGSSDPFDQGYSQLLKDHYNISSYGSYYFDEQNGSLVPVWDFRSTYAGNPNAIVYAQKVKNVPSPDGSSNVDWMELKKSSGNLVNISIYIVETVQGQPPSTCMPGSHESVKFAAKFYFV